MSCLKLGISGKEVLLEEFLSFGRLRIILSKASGCG
jgi:hypothetical protein